MDYKNQRILVIGAGELQIPLIQAAQALGVFVIASDQNPKALGFTHVDAYIIADTMDPASSLLAIQKYVAEKGMIHGVVTAGTDASLTVATIAHHFSLLGHSLDAASNASNKALMRKAFEKAEVSIPQYSQIKTLDEALNFFRTINKACVLKPISNMGARGISLVRTEKDLETAFSLATKYSKEQSLLIEEFIDAHELSIDALVKGEDIVITGIGDRIIEYPPYFVETGHIMPSSISEEWKERAIIAFKEGIKALGLSHGAAKADLKISADKTWIIEIAGRLSGGFMSSHTYPFSTGISLHEEMIKLALGGELPQIHDKKNLVSVERAIILPEGKITHIDIPSNILEQEYISHLSFRAQIGDIVISPKNNVDKAGNIIATAPTRELAHRAIHKALQSIQVHIEDNSNIDLLLKESYSIAKEKLKSVCNVCPYCDGLWCRGKIPGVGGVGTGEGFIQSYNRYRDIKFIPQYIHSITKADTSIEMFGQKFSMPVFVAPIAGAKINYNDSISELDLQRAFFKGAYQAGTLAFAPDPGAAEAFINIPKCILENYGHSIATMKPRENLEFIHDRFRQCLEVGVLGLGCDIDAVGLKTFVLMGQGTSPKPLAVWKDLINTYKMPFVMKGILSVSDALLAVEAGATHIIVSSHGGRIGESFPIPIDMLPMIKKAVGDKIKILIDGSIRSGSDVIKALLLGADAVLIGRPIAIHAVGGGSKAVKAYLQKIQSEIHAQMILLGVSTIEELKNHPEYILDQKTFYNNL